MLKVTSMLFCLTSPWEGPENCSQCFFLQTYYFGSRRIYCGAHECVTEASWCCTNSRNSIQRKSTTVYWQSGFNRDFITDCNTDTGLGVFLGHFLLINLFGSGKKKWIQCAHTRVLNPIKDCYGFFSQHFVSSKAWPFPHSFERVMRLLRPVYFRSACCWSGDKNTQ